MKRLALLSLLKSSDQLHVDATNRLVWQGYPILVCGVSSPTGKFFGTMSVLSSHEDTSSWSQLYSFIHGLENHFRFRMGDGAKEITKAGIKVYFIWLYFYIHIYKNDSINAFFLSVFSSGSLIQRFIFKYHINKKLISGFWWLPLLWRIGTTYVLAACI